MCFTKGLGILKSCGQGPGRTGLIFWNPAVAQGPTGAIGFSFKLGQKEMAVVPFGQVAKQYAQRLQCRNGLQWSSYSGPLCQQKPACFAASYSDLSGVCDLGLGEASFLVDPCLIVGW